MAVYNSQLIYPLLPFTGDPQTSTFQQTSLYKHFTNMCECRQVPLHKHAKLTLWITGLLPSFPRSSQTSRERSAQHCRQRCSTGLSSSPTSKCSSPTYSLRCLQQRKCRSPTGQRRSSTRSFECCSNRRVYRFRRIDPSSSWPSQCRSLRRSCPFRCVADIC